MNLYQRAIKIIYSCVNLKQLDTALNYIYLTKDKLNSKEYQSLLTEHTKKKLELQGFY